MSKFKAGVFVVGGLLAAIVFGAGSGIAANASNSPSEDGFYDVIKFGGMGLAVVCMGVFAYGASKFTNAK